MVTGSASTTPGYAAVAANNNSSQSPPGGLVMQSQNNFTTNQALSGVSGGGSDHLSYQNHINHNQALQL